MSARLVVADDDDAVRALLGAALAAYTVFPAARGDDALALVRRERPDLVVLDVQMPGLDGLAVARALGADPATAAIPVVLCSGAGPVAAAAAGRVAGVVAFLPKPVDLRELLGTVARALVAAPARPQTAAAATRLAPRSLARRHQDVGRGVTALDLALNRLHEALADPPPRRELDRLRRRCDQRLVDQPAVRRPAGGRRQARQHPPAGAAQRLGEVPDPALRVQIADGHGHAPSQPGQPAGRVDGRQRLAHPALAVGDDDGGRGRDWVALPPGGRSDCAVLAHVSDQ